MFVSGKISIPQFIDEDEGLHCLFQGNISTGIELNYPLIQEGIGKNGHLVPKNRENRAEAE